MTPNAHRRIAIVCIVAAFALITLLLIQGCGPDPEAVVYELKVEAECDGVIEVTTQHYCDDFNIDMKAKTQEVALQCQRDLVELGCARRRCNVSLRRTDVECSLEEVETE